MCGFVDTVDDPCLDCVETVESTVSTLSRQGSHQQKSSTWILMTFEYETFLNDVIFSLASCEFLIEATPV